MSELKSTSRHVAFDQVRGLLDFLSRHIDLARGNFHSLEARHLSKKLWAEVAQKLNNCRGGTRKSSDGWSKYWSNFKNKLKNKVRILNKRKRMGSTEKGVRPLTRIEKRALDILGPQFEPDTCEVPVVTPPRRPVGILQGLLEVKIEHEDDTQKKQESSREQSESEEITVTFGDPQVQVHRSEEEPDYTNDYDGTSDGNSNESLINTLYPKWLIEVERKRADAELIRARAEETRARASAAAAAAAAAQAEALRSLARAAAQQAEAVARIAALLDRAPSLLNI